MNLDSVLVGPASTIRGVMSSLQQSGRGIALVVDGERRLLATITDGDLRTAVLRGVDLSRPITEVIRHHKQHPYERPITAPARATREDLLRLMRRHSIRHVPLLDEEGRVRGLACESDLEGRSELPVTAVVMAGGYGRRLRPLTEEVPKPMLPVGDKPLMERIVERLREAGIRRVEITTHYKPHAIVDHFGNGERFGLDIQYVREEEPLGTAGSLRLLPPTNGPLLVVNGDILTQLDFRAMLEYHRDHRAEMTVGVRQFEMGVPYGVVESEGSLVVSLCEKPTYRIFINAGVYLLEPDVRGAIPEGRRFDMTELIHRLLEERRRVVSFPIHEFWLDIGRPADYERAQREMRAEEPAP